MTTSGITFHNGVRVDRLSAMTDRLRAQPGLAEVRFAARNRWIDGTATTSSIREWYGDGAKQEHVSEFSAPADHPTLGHGHGPTPEEYVLHALASSLTSGVVLVAAQREVELEHVEAVASGHMDARGSLGVDDTVRTGFGRIRVDLVVRGHAPANVLEALVETSRDRSPVYEMLSASTPIDLTVAS